MDIQKLSGAILPINLPMASTTVSASLIDCGNGLLYDG